MRQTFGNRRFANTRITHKQRVVLAAAAQHLNAAFNLIGASDQRINVTRAGFGVQIDAIGLPSALSFCSASLLAVCASSSTSSAPVTERFSP